MLPSELMTGSFEGPSPMPVPAVLLAYEDGFVGQEVAHVDVGDVVDVVLAGDEVGRLAVVGDVTRRWR